MTATSILLLVLVAAALGTAAGLQHWRWEFSHYEFDLARARQEPEDAPGLRQLVTDNFHRDQRARRRGAWPTLLLAVAFLAVALYIAVAGSASDDLGDLIVLVGASALVPWLGITGYRWVSWTSNGPRGLTWPTSPDPPG